MSDPADVAEVKNSHATIAHKNSASVAYVAPRSEMGIRYTAVGYKLKEEIVLKSLPQQTAFVFDFYYSGLTAVLREDKTVLFSDQDGNGIFVIDAPFMYDNTADGYSNNIAVTLTPTQTGCTYTLTPDRAWLEDPARVYPVVIDPTATIPQTTSAFMDAGVQQANPTTIYNGYDRAYIGTDAYSCLGRYYIACNQWPTETFLDADSIISAKLQMSYYPQASWQTYYECTMRIMKNSQSWNESSICWNNQLNQQDTQIGLLYIPNRRGVTGGTEIFDVTAWAQAHYSSPSTDYGIRLQTWGVTATINRLCFATANYSQQGLRPKMQIIYNYLYGMLGITQEGVDRTSFMDLPVPTGYTKSRNINLNHQQTLSLMQDSRIFIGRSHGNATTFVCYNGNLTKDTMQALQPGELNNLKLVVYGACATAQGGLQGDNLVNATYEAGAQAVIGFTDRVGAEGCNGWVKALITSLNSGNTIHDAMDDADDAVREQPENTTTNFVRGEEYTSIC